MISNKKILKFYVGAGLVLILLLFNSWFIYFNFEMVNKREKLVSETSNIINQLNEFISAVKDAETGARGYVLTLDEHFLDPYWSGIKLSRQRLDRLAFTIEKDPTQRALLLSLNQNLDKRLKLLDDVVTAVKQTQVRPEAKLLQFAEGKVLMDALRELVEKSKQREKELLAQRSNHTEDSRENFLYALFFTTALVSLLLIFATIRLANNQKSLDKDLQDQLIENENRQVIGEVSEILTGDKSIEHLSYQVLDYFVKKFDILAGRLFIVSTTGVNCVAAIGVEDNEPIARSKHHGLLNRALAHKGFWEIENVPADYWKLHSSLGNSVPNFILFMPFEFQGKLIGLFEFAGFKSLNQQQKELISSLSERLGSGLSAALSRNELKKLLEKTQQQSEELLAQQEELKTSNEELETQTKNLETQQKTLALKNQELESVQNVLRAKAIELEKASKYKSEFLAKMSHELRTPLNSLMILASLLIENKSNNLTDKQIDFAKSIKSAGQDLLMLINDILDLSKVEAKKLAIRPTQFTLAELFNAKKLTFLPQINEKKLKFDLILPDSLVNFSLNTDRQRLDQILRNFISNAIKFTDKGEVSLEAKLNKDNSRITFLVKDTGIGIPSNKLEAIFDAFEQADGSVSRKYGGTGLGLTISRELSILLGGKIDVQSEEGIGSTFSIEIPVSIYSQVLNDEEKTVKDSKESKNVNFLSDQDKPVIKTNTTIIQSSINDSRILVVEDDEKFRKSICEVIKTYGLIPVEFEDGETAMEFLEDNTPAAILLDIKLPGISGINLLENIKHMSHLRHVPVHVISGLDFKNNVLKLGAVGYAKKPISIENLYDVIFNVQKQIANSIHNVLIIEDDQARSAQIKDLILGEDVSVQTCTAGELAIELLKQGQFGCVVINLKFIGTRGYKFLDEVMKLSSGPPPIIVYADENISDDDKNYLKKFDDIVIKGAKSSAQVLDEVNLFIHRVESLMSEDKKILLSGLRRNDTSLAGKSVLLVDDDIRNIFALTSALEAKGMTVTTARDGVEALEKLDVKDIRLDIILMDIMMPRMNGFEAIENIRKLENKRVSQIPIVALTAKAMKEDFEKCIRVGANDYLAKPINFESLITILKVWLEPKNIF